MEAPGVTGIVRKWWWLLAIGALFAFAAWAVSQRVRGNEEPVTYRAAASVFVSAQPRQAFDAPLSEPGRLTASYAEIIRGRAVAQRVATFFELPDRAEQIQSLIATRVVPGTQMIEVTVTAATATEADRIAGGVTQAFAAMHEEEALPGQIHVMDIAPAQEIAIAHRSPLAEAALSVLAGLFASATVVMAIEFLSRGGQRRDEGEVVERAPDAGEAAPRPRKLPRRAPRVRVADQAS